MNSNWERLYISLDEIKNDLGLLVSPKVGWIESLTDTLLILVIDIEKPTYLVKCWNRPNVRAEMKRLIEMPVITITPL